MTSETKFIWADVPEQSRWMRSFDATGLLALILFAAAMSFFILWGFRFDAITKNFWYLMAGLAETWRLAVLSFSLGLAIGIVLAVARTSRFRIVRSAAGLYVEILRNVPQLMVIFWIYFLLPTFTGKSLDAYVAAVIALTGCVSAYLAEVVRAGLRSVPGGQMEAAATTGLTYLQAMRFVILPQALRNMIPSLVNQFVSAFKTTSLVYIIGVIEFFRAATIVNERDFKSEEIFAFVGCVYFINCFCMSTAAKWLERRLHSNL